MAYPIIHTKNTECALSIAGARPIVPVNSHSWYNDNCSQRAHPAAVLGYIIQLVKMLASRILPPIHPPPSPPLATFSHTPRRYAKSNMQAVENASSPLSMDEVKSSRSLRKGNRFYELRSSPTSNPTQRLDNELPSPASSTASGKHNNKRSQDDLNGVEQGNLSDLENSRAPGSSASSSPGEHVCLCQPEPKIPRPRNGKPAILFVAQSDVTQQ